MKTIKMAEDLVIEARGPGDVDGPQVIIKEVTDDPRSETQAVIIYAHEIKAVIAALTEAAVHLANQVDKGRDYEEKTGDLV